jgi:hypothetical protein
LTRQVEDPHQVKALDAEAVQVAFKGNSHAGAAYCPDCWGKRFRLRAVILPVAAPLGSDWPTLRTALAGCWHQSTALANWAVTELAKADVVRMPGDEHMPAMPRLR